MAFEISNHAAFPDETDTNQTEANHKPAAQTEAPLPEKKSYRVGIVSVMPAFAAVFAIIFAVRLLDRANVFSHLSKGAGYAVFALVTVFAYILPGVVYTLIRRKNGGSVTVFRHTAPHTVGFTVLMGLLVLMTGILCRFYLMRQASEIVTDSLISSMQAGDSPYLLLIFGLLPAITEEYFFRGVMQGELTKIGGGITGILISALASALCVPDGKLFTEMFLVGLLLGLLTHVCGSFVPSAVVRVIVHTLAVLFADRLRFIAAERAGNAFTMILIVMLWLILLIASMRAGAGVCADKARRVELITAPTADAQNAQGAETNIAEASCDMPDRVTTAGLMQHLSAPCGFTLLKFSRVLFSPVMIICAALFALLAFR